MPLRAADAADAVYVEDSHPQRRPGDSGRDERRRLDMLAQPELEHQQAPKSVAVIHVPRLVLADQLSELSVAKPASLVPQHVVRQLAEVGTEPPPERHAEAALPARADVRWQERAKGLSQRDLSGPAPGLQRIRQRQTELEHALVEQRRSQLERMRHRSDVRFWQKIAREVRRNVQQLQPRQ